MSSEHTKNMPSEIAKYSLAIQKNVSWGDMDAYGHVNNTRYFRYFEDVRIAYFEEMQGMSELENASHVGVVVASTSCKFKRPIKYPDQLWIAARISNVDETRFTMNYAIYSEQAKAIAATGEALLVAYDLVESRPTELTKEMLAGIQRIEASILK